MSPKCVRGKLDFFDKDSNNIDNSPTTTAKKIDAEWFLFTFLKTPFVATLFQVFVFRFRTEALGHLDDK